ncbi:MAG: two-component regulator propeller domain-containing protein [Cyclobacteriaceae bacterium]
MERPLPKSFSIAPKTDSIAQVPLPTDRVQPDTHPVKSKKNTRINAHPNVHKAPDNLVEIIVNKEKLIKSQFSPVQNGQVPNLIINNAGDTVKTGIPTKVKGEILDIGLMKMTPALKPRFRDMAIYDIQYLDVDQGLASSYAFSVLEDRFGSIWFGHGLGFSKYDGVNFTHFSFGGLGYVWAMLEDRAGNLWFGTLSNGLIKYDGLTFTQYSENLGLLHDEILSLKEDSKGNIWIGSGGGLTKYDGHYFTHYTTNEGLMPGPINAIAQDSHGVLWLGTDEGVIQFDGSEFVRYTTENGLSNNSVISILEDESGHLWFGTEGGGVNKFNGETFIHYTTDEGLSHNVVRSIQKDKNGNLWFSTDGGGTNLFDGTSFTHFAEREGQYEDVFGSCFDSSGNLWLVTNGGGVSRLSPNSFVHYSETEGLSNSYIYNIKEDTEGSLWIGTDGGGIDKYDGAYFINYTIADGLVGNSIAYLLEDSKGNIWIGTHYNGVSQFDGKNFINYSKIFGASNIQYIAEDTDGNIWFVPEQSGVIRYDGKSFTHFTRKEGLVSNAVNTILNDSQGNLWFGTDDGISRYDGHTFTNYSQTNGFGLDNIDCMIEDHKGNIWLGSRSSGVFMFDGDKFVHYTEREGLSFNITWALLEDNHHHIWVTTERGLNMFVPTEIGDNSYRIISYDQGDGLKGNDFYSNSIFIDSRNQLWMGSGKSLTMLDLDKHQIPQSTPETQILQVDINGEMIDYQKLERKKTKGIKFDSIKPFHKYPVNLQLAHDKNHLTIAYIAIDWQAPHDLRYSFILEGLNTNWSAPTEDTKVDYRNIPPGEYTFKVRSRGKSANWSEEANFSFTILPPWHQTWWAYLSYFVALVLIGYSYTYWRTQNLMRQKNVLEATVASRTADLKKSNDLLKEQKEEIQIQAFELKKLNDLKSKFYSVVGHDLRSPLTKLFAVVFKVKRKLDSSDSEMKKMFAEFDGLYQNFVELLDNVLDWGLIDSNRKKIVLQPEYLDEVVENIVGLYEPQALDKQIALSFENKLPEDLMVQIDKGSMEIVIRNLLGNAIKFTHEGGEIKVTTYTENQKAFIRVVDTGVGIPEDKLATIFEITEKKQTIGTKGEKGTGLGLKLAHDFVLLNQGDIKITSGPGKGTSITIELALA